MIRTYSEIVTLNSFEDRYNYLKTIKKIGDMTFGWKRYLNQVFYRSSRWKQIRNKVIIRDMACDLGVEGYDIQEKIIVHHMNPITIYDIENETEYLTNPEYLITTSFSTHEMLEFGTDFVNRYELITRYKNDTCPWKVGDKYER